MKLLAFLIALAFSGAVIAPTAVSVSDVADVETFGVPMSHASSRVTKKTFAFLVEEGHSPVPLDRFHGYHVGVDFETFGDEQIGDVEIYAICDGPLLVKTWANGYGGVAVQACELDGEAVTVVYGHLDVVSVMTETGQTVSRGDRLGVLGDGYSEETDGVRKHLHLGIHKGPDIELRGYVQDQAETDGWIDAQTVIK